MPWGVTLLLCLANTEMEQIHMDRSSDEIRVLHVDDDSEFLAIASERLEAADDRISVTTVDDPIAALDALDEVDCVVSDYQMPELDGLGLFEAIRSDYPDLPFILYTGEESEEVACEAVSVGVTDYLQKGVGAEQYALLANRVRNAVERVTAQRAVREARETERSEVSDGRAGSRATRETERSEVSDGRAGSGASGGAGDGADWHRAVVDTMAEGVYVIDAEYGLRFVNYRIGDEPVISADDWIGESLSYLAEGGILSETEVASVEAGVDAVVDGEADEVRVELEPAVMPDAEVVELRLTPMVVGRETLVLGTTRDVTDRIEREEKLKWTTERYRTLIDNFPNGGVFTFDETLRYTLAGGEELAEIGLTSDDFEGATPFDLFPADIADEIDSYYRKALAGEHHTFEQQYQGNHYRIHTLPVGDDEVTAGMAVSQNVTDRVEQQRELERQNERLEEFTSVVSHDLRNPLTVLKGALQLAEETGEREHFERGHRAVDRMERLVEDLRTLARHGDRVTDLECVRLAETAAVSWDTVETGDATLQVDSTATVMADEGRLRQLFENLFRNAVEHGGPDVTVTVDDHADGFFVADDGPGIAPEDRDVVFESGYSTSEEGTGFGLAIVSEIVSAHGWTVDVTESESGGVSDEWSESEVRETESPGARFEVSGVDLLC
jgi:PAS domain S-box-containing protein